MFTPATTAASISPAKRAEEAACKAYKDDEQAVSITELGPFRLKM
jgi:hypothetical protein